MLLRIRARICLPVVTLACASAGAHPEPDVEATLTRGGGLAAITETVRVWRIGPQAQAELRRSDSQRPQVVRLSSAAVATSLESLDSLAGVVPPVTPDAGTMQRLCGDVTTTHFTVRRGQQVRVAQEACPHLGAALEAYWRRVNSLFDVLAKAAR